MKPLIGFIGQGYIGKNYADDFENRGFSVVRYALHEPYKANGTKIPQCDIVFIAVPTPTTPEGFSDKVVREVVKLVGKGKIAVIKSTVLPGTTEKVQAENPDVTVLSSPEFLSEATAAHDAANPFSNIIGLPVDDEAHRKAAEEVLAVLPKAPYSLIATSKEAEIIKYAHNFSAYTQIVTFNIVYDIAKHFGYDFEHIGEALKADSLISSRYANPIHKSGRGAGGHCFIKDVAALRALYEDLLGNDAVGVAFLKALEEKNKSLLRDSGKDLDWLAEVYGKEAGATQ